MDFESLVNERYTVRDFDSKPLVKTEILKIIEAGRRAPSAKNLQPLKIYVCVSKDSLHKIDSVSPCRYNAPVAFIICASRDKAWSKEGYSSYETDASICTTYMMLESANLGLGSVWVGMFDTNKTKEAFNIPEEYTPISMLMVGNKKENTKPLPSHDQRKIMTELVEFL